MENFYKDPNENPLQKRLKEVNWNQPIWAMANRDRIIKAMWWVVPNKESVVLYWRPESVHDESDITNRINELKGQL